MKRLSAENVTVGVVLKSLPNWDSIPGGLIHPRKNFTGGCLLLAEPWFWQHSNFYIAEGIDACVLHVMHVFVANLSVIDGMVMFCVIISHVLWSRRPIHLDLLLLLTILDPMITHVHVFSKPLFQCSLRKICIVLIVSFDWHWSGLFISCICKVVSKIYGYLAVMVRGRDFAFCGTWDNMFDEFAFGVKWTVRLWIMVRFDLMLWFIT